MDNILNTILKNTYSLTQLKHRLSILKAYLLKNFFGTVSLKATLAEADLNWLKSLPEDFLKTFNKDSVYKIFEDLEEQLTKVQPLIIYLTFEPDDQSLAQIGEMGRKTFGKPQLLLDIKYDPRLIAGAALSFKGIYRDYSLRARIEERKMIILESFRKFLR